jgi:hypothetical protein
MTIVLGEGNVLWSWVMTYYHVNKNAQSNGDHEVHTSICSHAPDQENRQQLGEHASCWSAVSAAKRYYTQCNGCYYCCNPCHTT